MADRMGVIAVCILAAMSITFSLGIYQEAEVRRSNQNACEQSGLTKVIEVQPVKNVVWDINDNPRYVKCSGFITVNNHIEAVEQWVFINGSKP